MNKNSLAAVSITNRLVEAHDASMSGGLLVERPGPDVARTEYMGIAYTGRFRTRNGKRSGGYTLSARLTDKFEHTYAPIERVRTLSPGWDRKHLQGAAHALLLQMTDLRHVARMRELVMQTADRKIISDDYLDLIAEGHPIAYTDMTLADCEFWLSTLAKFPDAKEKE